MKIKNDNLPLPVSPLFALYLLSLIGDYENEKAVTINFRDPNYSAETGGYHPVEIRLENEMSGWRFCYITDFCYVGSGYMAELAKDLDFDFTAGVFQNMFGTFPIEQATEIYQTWESNFLFYATVNKAFKISFTTE